MTSEMTLDSPPRQPFSVDSDPRLVLDQLQDGLAEWVCDDPAYPILHIQHGLIEDDFGVVGSALISADGLYRWSLTRRWGRGPMLTWLMLNPSTADAFTDDPTIRRCIGFAKAWGYGGIVVVNLFALRATHPELLNQHPDPVGPRNDDMILAAARAHSPLVVAWGADAPAERVQAVTDLLSLEQRADPDGQCARLLALGHTKAGFPRHPLYVRADTSPVDYSCPDAEVA